MSERRYAAAVKRLERLEKQRAKELAKRAKEHERLSALEQAKLEVETFENEIAVLLSVHKECREAIDWPRLAAALPPPLPFNREGGEAATRLKNLMPRLVGDFTDVEPAIRAARSKDRDELAAAERAHFEQAADWTGRIALARGVRAGVAAAYENVLNDEDPFEELKVLGVSVETKVHDGALIECWMRVGGIGVVPVETKSLSSGGKVLVKATPRLRVQEIYQDYLCGNVLRVAREILALLPVNTVLLTVRTPTSDVQTGLLSDAPVLSVFLPRATVESLNFESLDPSDTLDALGARSNFKASRRTAVWEPIVPLQPADLSTVAPSRGSLVELVESARRLRASLKSIDLNSE